MKITRMSFVIFMSPFKFQINEFKKIQTPSCFDLISPLGNKKYKINFVKS